MWSSNFLFLSNKSNIIHNRKLVKRLRVNKQYTGIQYTTIYEILFSSYKAVYKTIIMFQSQTVHLTIHSYVEFYFWKVFCLKKKLLAHIMESILWDGYIKKLWAKKYKNWYNNLLFWSRLKKKNGITIAE